MLKWYYMYTRAKRKQLHHDASISIVKIVLRKYLQRFDFPNIFIITTCYIQQYGEDSTHTTLD